MNGRYEHKAVTNREYDDMMRDQRTALNDMATSLKRANAIAGLKELFSIGCVSEIAYRDGLAMLLDREGFNIKDCLIKKDSGEEA